MGGGRGDGEEDAIRYGDRGAGHEAPSAKQPADRSRRPRDEPLGIVPGLGEVQTRCDDRTIGTMKSKAQIERRLSELEVELPDLYEEARTKTFDWEKFYKVVAERRLLRWVL